MDGKGGWDCLVGQKISPDLTGVPITWISNYQWKVTGTTMQSWTVSADQSYTTLVSGPGPMNVTNPEWFWNDANNSTEKISCTATVTPPAGKGSPFSVTASQTVGVWLPTWNAKGIGGQMLVDIPPPPPYGSGNGKDYWLQASPGSDPDEIGGMTWYAFVSPPTGCPVAFDSGELEIVQLIIPGDGYVDYTHTEYVLADEGQIGLDTSWPYGWVQYEDTLRTIQPDYMSNDSPGIDLTNLLAIFGYVSETFNDYIMFQPPGSPQYVPLGNFTWSTNGAAIIPNSNSWSNYINPAGPIDPSGSFVPFTANNNFPSWIRNSGNGIGWVLD
jgi:hypothetical protein